MLIDSSHKRWFLATLLVAVLALMVYLGLIWLKPSWMDGGRSVGGLWYGTIGSGLMVYAGLLSVLRRVPSWWWIGSRKVWLRGHIWLGLLSFLFLLCHSNFRWGGVLVFGLTVEGAASSERLGFTVAIPASGGGSSR